MSATVEQLDYAFDRGAWRQRLDEVGRCLTIYRHPDAREKPITCWSLLPLGLSAENTIKLLGTMIEEHPEHADIVHPDQLAVLEDRLEHLKLEHEVWMNRNVKKH